MPNHVEHDLVVSGPIADLRAFQDVAREGDKLLSANKFIPYPTNLALLDAASRKERDDNPRGPWKLKDGFNQGGYEWCMENWGTKWGIYNAKLTNDVTRDGDEQYGPLEYTFKSAWSPATKIIAAMSKKFPHLTFDLHYFERGMEFQGHVILRGGDVVHEEEQTEYHGTRGG